MQLAQWRILVLSQPRSMLRIALGAASDESRCHVRGGPVGRALFKICVPLIPGPIHEVLIVDDVALGGQATLLDRRAVNHVLINQANRLDVAQFRPWFARLNGVRVDIVHRGNVAIDVDLDHARDT